MLTLFTHKKSLLRCRRDQKEGLLWKTMVYGAGDQEANEANKADEN